MLESFQASMEGTGLGVMGSTGVGHTTKVTYNNCMCSQGKKLSLPFK